MLVPKLGRTPTTQRHPIVHCIVNRKFTKPRLTLGKELIRFRAVRHEKRLPTYVWRYALCGKEEQSVFCMSLHEFAKTRQLI